MDFLSTVSAFMSFGRALLKPVGTPTPTQWALSSLVAVPTDVEPVLQARGMQEADVILNPSERLQDQHGAELPDCMMKQEGERG